jgi:hypothetical protein
MGLLCTQDKKEDEDMLINTPSPLKRTFRINIDIEVEFHADPPAGARSTAQQAYHNELVQALLAHPDRLMKLQEAHAVEMLGPAKKALESDYGWVRHPEQQLLQPVMEELSPAARTYFTEELEEQVSYYDLDDIAETTIKRCTLTEQTNYSGRQKG